MISAIVAPIVSRIDASIAKGRLVKRSANMSPTVDSATQPRPRLASVTPSWLAESTREIFEEARSAMRASRSPLRVIASRRVRRERTRANSIALLADAGHMLTDVAALGLALFVAWFSRHPGTPEKTYGYLRWEILAALINGSTLLLISGWILWEAAMRLRAPQPVAGGLMLAVASAGLLLNIVAARLLVGSSAHNLNARGAYLHILGD